MSAVTARKGRPAGRRRLGSLAAKTGFVVVVLLAWQGAAASGWLGAVPTPVAVAAAFGELVRSNALWAPLGQTLASWSISLVLAVVVGVVIGFVLGASDLAYRITAFVLDFCRTIPALALVPLAVLMFGAGLVSTVLLAFVGAVWAALLQTIYGVRDVDPVARDTFRSLRISPLRRVTTLVLPSAAPYIATGVRLAAAICLLLTLSAQIVIPAGGIGQAIVIAQLGGAIPRMYAFIVLCGVLGVLINALFVVLERIVLRWHPSYRKTIR